MRWRSVWRAERPGWRRSLADVVVAERDKGYAYGERRTTRTTRFLSATHSRALLVAFHIHKEASPRVQRHFPFWVAARPFECVHLLEWRTELSSVGRRSLRPSPMPPTEARAPPATSDSCLLRRCSQQIGISDCRPSGWVPLPYSGNAHDDASGRPPDVRRVRRTLQRVMRLHAMFFSPTCVNLARCGA